MEIRSDLATIFKMSVKDVDISHENHSIQTFGGMEVVRGATTIRIQGYVEFGYHIDETMKTFRNWLGTNHKVDIGPFKGVLPLNMETGFNFETGTKHMRIEYSCDYIEYDYTEYLSIRTPTKKPEKKEYFEEDLFEV